MNPAWTHRESPWPTLRNLTATVLDLQPAHTFSGFTSANVTRTLERLEHCQRATRRVVSLHAFLLACGARAAAEHPIVLTFRHRGRLITFDSVDVGTALNKRMPDGTWLPVIYVLREADRKSHARIQHEFRQAVRRDLTDDPAVRARRRLAGWPGWLRHLVLRRLLGNPFRLRELYGNVQLTSLYHPAMQRPFAAFPPILGTVAVAAGSVAPGVVPGPGGVPVTAQLLHFGAIMNHDIIDGMAAVACVRRFLELVEDGAGLDDAFIEETRALRDQEEA